MTIWFDLHEFRNRLRYAFGFEGWEDQADLFSVGGEYIKVAGVLHQIIVSTCSVVRIYAGARLAIQVGVITSKALCERTKFAGFTGDGGQGRAEVGHIFFQGGG